MNNDKALITVSHGNKYLCDIKDADKELEIYSRFFNDPENEVYYYEFQPGYVIKRSLETSGADIKSRLELTKSHFEISDSTVIPKRDPSDVFDFDVTNNKNGIKSPTGNLYDVLMCVPRLKPYETVNTDSVVDACIELCNILDKEYHQKGNYHNNVNHQNLFLRDGKIVLGNCSLGGVKNKIVWYNAPEILRGDDPTVQSDIFSLGMWLYSMLCSDDDNIFVKKERVAVFEYEISLTNDAKRYQNIVRKALSINPKDRYKNCRAFRKALEKVRKNRRQRQTERRNKSSGVLKALICLIVLIVVAAAALGVRLIYNSIANYDPEIDRIEGMISSGAYSLAYEEIIKRSSDEATDALIMEYIDACFENGDYARAAGIIENFSQAEFNSPKYLEDVFETFESKAQMKVLNPVFEKIYSKSDAVAELIDRYRG